MCILHSGHWLNLYWYDNLPDQSELVTAICINCLGLCLFYFQLFACLTFLQKYQASQANARDSGTSCDETTTFGIEKAFLQSFTSVLCFSSYSLVLCTSPALHMTHEQSCVTSGSSESYTFLLHPFCKKVSGLLPSLVLVVCVKDQSRYRIS